MDFHIITSRGIARIGSKYAGEDFYAAQEEIVLDGVSFMDEVPDESQVGAAVEHSL